MSKRLQALLSEDEVNSSGRLRRARSCRSASGYGAFSEEQSLSRRRPPRKLRAIREAYKHSFPAGDVDQMNREIERGCSKSLFLAYSQLSARDAVHVVVMHMKGIDMMLSFDQGFDLVPTVQRIRP